MRSQHMQANCHIVKLRVLYEKTSTIVLFGTNHHILGDVYCMKKHPCNCLGKNIRSRNTIRQILVYGVRYKRSHYCNSLEEQHAVATHAN